MMFNITKYCLFCCLSSDLKPHKSTLFTPKMRNVGEVSMNTKRYFFVSCQESTLQVLSINNAA